MPLWIGGVGEKRTLKIVAQHATGWHAAYISPTEYSRLGRILDRHCDDAGRDPTSVERSINLMFDLGRDEGSLTAEWGDMWERVSGGSLHGTSEQVVDRILEYGEAGADMVNIALRAPVDPDMIDAYLGEILPAVGAN
jgi:alkanesulfonate monooxygenase SsuD/methylene tetrahydromethanopterin reductase-like flavin-dependent oxidoreductase (luciferase family)